MQYAHIVSNVLDTESQGLLHAKHILNTQVAESFDTVIDKILTITQNKGRVIVCGMGKSGLVGRKISATLASTGTPSYFVHPAEAVHGDLGMIAPNDAVLLLSNSGETAELSGVLSYIKRHNIFALAITKGTDSTLAQGVDIVLPLGDTPEACPLGLAPTTSTTVTMAIGDVLAVALLQARNFTAEDFKGFHPSGQLGAKLLSAGDIMQTGDTLPFAIPHMTVGETAKIMQDGRLGCVGILNNGILQGIFTDGDLLRHINTGNDLSGRIDTYMTKDPIRVTEKIFASEVLRTLQTHKISAVFVVDDTNHPLGIVHFHDCLKYGVA